MEKLVALIGREGETVVVESPAVGIVYRLPPMGVHLSPLQPAFLLSRLGRSNQVILPRQAGFTGGFVTRRLAGDCSGSLYIPVEYKEPLIELSMTAGRQTTDSVTAEAGTAPESGDILSVLSPSDGIFYRRKSPDSPPYVTEGSAVERGTVLALVEVMKSFNPIQYGNPGLPERGTIVKILAEDSAEVRFGQPLFLVEPAS